MQTVQTLRYRDANGSDTEIQNADGSDSEIQMLQTAQILVLRYRDADGSHAEIQRCRRFRCQTVQMLRYRVEDSSEARCRDAKCGYSLSAGEECPARLPGKAEDV